MSFFQVNLANVLFVRNYVRRTDSVCLFYKNTTSRVFPCRREYSCTCGQIPKGSLPWPAVSQHFCSSDGLPIGFSSAVAAATAVGGLTSSPSAAPKIHAAARQRLFAQNAGGAVCMIDCYGVKFHHATAGTHSFQMAENTRHMSTPENRTHFTAKASSRGAIRNPSLYVCELFGAYSKASNQ